MAELVDATREFGTLLFTGLEIQWLPLYRLEPGLLHEYRFNSYSLTEVAEVISALPFWRFSDRFDSTERRHTGVHIGMLCAQPEVCMPDRYRLRPQSPFLKDVLSDSTGIKFLRYYETKANITNAQQTARHIAGPNR